MAEQKLEVIVRAIDLMNHSLRITSNRKRYPVKYIQLINRIQNNAMDIYEYLIEANRIDLYSSKAERIELETRVITACDKLSCFVEMSMNLNLVGADTVDYWQTKINDVKHMTLALRKKDKAR